MKAIRAIAREHAWLAIVAVSSLVGFTILGVAVRSSATVPYLVSLALAMWFVASVHARAPLSAPVLWGLALWEAAHLAGGIIPSRDAVLYNVQLIPVILRYDQLVHAFGFGVAALGCGEFLRARIPGPVTAGAAFLAALGGMGFGAINEVIEFVTSQLIETNVGGYVNTGWDLVANMIGATAAGLWIRFRPASGTT